MHALLDSFISSIRPFIHLIHCIRSCLPFIYVNSLLSISPTIPISKLVPIVMPYFWNFRPGACRALPGMSLYNFYFLDSRIQKIAVSLVCSWLNGLDLDILGHLHVQYWCFREPKLGMGQHFSGRHMFFLHIVSIHFGAAPVWPSQPWPLAPELANLPKWHKMSRSGLEITGMTDAKTDGGGCGYVIKAALQYVTIAGG